MRIRISIRIGTSMNVDAGKDIGSGMTCIPRRGSDMSITMSITMTPPMVGFGVGVGDGHGSDDLEIELWLMDVHIHVGIEIGSIHCECWCMEWTNKYGVASCSV